jgi:predicted ABC-type ATPase
MLPEEVVRRRFHRGLGNFFELYVPMVDNWLIFDGSRGDPELVVFSLAGLQLVFDRDLLATMKGEVQEP